MTTLLFKRGASFGATCTYQPPEGGRPNLIGATVTSQLRLRNRLLQDFVCTLAPDGMSFTIEADEDDTNAWPIAVCDWDIRIEADGNVTYSETLQLNVMYAVTQVEVP